MKKVAFVLTIAFMISICFSGTLLAKEDLLDTIQKRGLIKVGMYLQFPPTEFRHPKTKEPMGLNVDFANQLAKDLGVKLEIVDMEWDAIIPGLIAKKYDIILASMSRTPQRNLSIAITSQSLEDYTIVGLKRKEDPRKKPEEFNKKDVVVTGILGSTTDFTIKRFFPEATFKGMQATPAVLEVEAGRADLFVQANMYCYEYLLNNPNSKLEIVFDDNPLAREPSGIGLRKGDPYLLDWLDNWIQFHWHQGLIPQLIDKWVKKRPDLKLK